MKRLAAACAVCLFSMAGLAGGCVVSPDRLDPQPEKVLYDGQRVLVLGDSISQDGRWVEYLDGYFQTRRPDDRIEWINIGLSGETVSGLSEPDHPGRRPHVHDRLDAALAATEPDVVLVFYGMNDGIYSPFDAERFAAYREGMWHVIERIEQAGARPILLTPPPFDKGPIADRVVPADAEVHGYQAPYEDYDRVLSRYGAWLRTLRDERYRVVDVGGESRHHLRERAEVEPEYTLAPDGVHPHAFGHWMIAQAVLASFDAPGAVAVATIDADREVASADVHHLDVDEKRGLAFTWSSRAPMPMDPAWPPELVAHERIDERFNRHRLIVTNLPGETYELYEGTRYLGTLRREALNDGVDMLAFGDLTTNRRAGEIGGLVRQRQRLLSDAWREHIENEPAEAADGLPLDEAKQQAAALEREIHDLARPVALELRLVPAD